MHSKYIPNWLHSVHSWIKFMDKRNQSNCNPSYRSIDIKIVNQFQRMITYAMAVQFKVPCNPFSLKTIHTRRLCRHFSFRLSLRRRRCPTLRSHSLSFLSYTNINLFAMFYSSCNIKCFHLGFSASLSHSKSWKKHDEWPKCLYRILGIITHFQVFSFIFGFGTFNSPFTAAVLWLTNSARWDFCLLKKGKTLEALCETNFIFTPQVHRHTETRRKTERNFLGPFKIEMKKKKCSKNVFTEHRTFFFVGIASKFLYK